MSASPDVALVVVHDGVRKEFQIPKTQKQAGLRADARSFLNSIFAAFNVSSQDYDIQHYRSRAKLNEESLRSLETAAASSNDALVCNLVRKKRRGSVSSDVEERRSVDLPPTSCITEGPRCVKIYRQDGGFGFTLRYFVVHPPRQLKGAPLEPMDTIFVKQVVKGSPGELAGLKVGDRLEMVNNMSVQGKTYDQVIKMVKSSGDVLSLLVTPREDDHIQELFQLDAYGPDGEGTVRSSKVIARSQDFTSPLSPIEHYSQPVTEPFNRSSQGRSVIRSRTSPGTAHRRPSSSKSGLSASGSSSSVNELLHQLQQQKPTRTPSRTSSQSSLNMDGDSGHHTPPWLQNVEQATSSLQASLQKSSSPAVHKHRKGYLGQGRSVSCDSGNIKSISAESVDRARHQGRLETPGFLKDGAYLPTGASHSTGHHERSMSLTHPLSLMSKVEKSSGSLTNLSNVDSGRRPRSGSAGESRFQQLSSGGSHSSSIPHYLKGPQHHRAAPEQDGGFADESYCEDKSVSLEELTTRRYEGRHMKSSSLPKNAQLRESYLDRASTEDETSERLQPVAVTHSQSEEHIAETMQFAVPRSNSGSALPFTAPVTDMDWGNHLDSPVTTIMATHAVRARRDGRRRGERRYVDASPGDSQPSFLRTKAMSTMGFVDDDLPVTEITATHHKSQSVVTRPTFESQPNLHRRTPSVKSNSLPHDSSPPQSTRVTGRKRSGLPLLVKGLIMPSPRTQKKFLQPPSAYGDGDESEDDLKVSNLQKKTAGDRLSLSAPSSPTSQKKLTMLDGNKSDYTEDDDDILESTPSKSRVRPFSRIKGKKSKSDTHSQQHHDSEAVAAVFKGDSCITAPPELCKKTVLLPGGRKAHDRSWRHCFAVQQGTLITFYKDERELSTEAQGAMEIADATINIQGCLVDIAHNYSKKPNVFRLQTADGAEYLLQASNFSASIKWIQLIRKAGTVDEADGGGLTDLIIQKTEQQKQHQTDHGSRSPVEDNDGGKLTTSVKRGAQSPGVKRRQKNRDDTGMSKRNIRRIFRRKNSFVSEDKSFNVLIEFCPRSQLYRKIPLVVFKCVLSVEKLGMSSVGIYRVPGNKTSVDSLVKEVDSRLTEMDLCDESKVDDINVVSSLLKLFFRQLPNPLLTFELYPSFIEASRITDSQERLKALIKLIQELPEINYHTLHYLIRHLCCVAEHSSENKMEPNNLAIVFGPTLVRSDSEEASQMVSDMGEQCRVIETLIKEVDQIFPKDDEFGNTYQKEDSFSQQVESPPPSYRPHSVSPQVASSPPPEVTVEEVVFTAQANEQEEAISKSKGKADRRSKHFDLPSAPPMVQNADVRPIDIYGNEPTLSLENFLEEQSRESSRAQVAQAKQDTTERWVMMHQWAPAEAALPPDWLENGGEISAEAKAIADAIQQRGDSYRYEAQRRPADKKGQPSTEPSSVHTPDTTVQPRWQSSANGDGDQYNYSSQNKPRQHNSPSRRRGRKNPLDGSAMLHRMSYVHAVHDGAVQLPLSKVGETDDDKPQRRSFPISPLDVPLYPYPGDGDDESGPYSRRGSDRQDAADHRPMRPSYQLDHGSRHGDDYEADHEMYPSHTHTAGSNHHANTNKWLKKTSKSLQLAADEMGHVATDL